MSSNTNLSRLCNPYYNSKIYLMYYQFGFQLISKFISKQRRAYQVSLITYLNVYVCFCQMQILNSVVCGAVSLSFIFPFLLQCAWTPMSYIMLGIIFIAYSSSGFTPDHKVQKGEKKTNLPETHDSQIGEDRSMTWQEGMHLIGLEPRRDCLWVMPGNSTPITQLSPR